MPMLNMIEMGFTERQYYEEFTLSTLAVLTEYDAAKALAIRSQATTSKIQRG